MYNPTMINNRERREFLKGKLLKQDGSSITETGFNYSVYSGRAYNATIAGMPFQYVKPTETIRVSRLDLPFASGDKIKLYDGRIMTVQSINIQTDNNKAQLSGDPREALVITLEGGGK